MPKPAVAANAASLPEETRSISDAIDLLSQATSLNELIFMAGESIAIRSMKEAITTGASVIDDVLGEVKAILYANIEREGGAA